MKYTESVLNQLRNTNSEELSLNLIEKLVRYICNMKDPGAILIFLPGMMDISQLNKMMLDSGCYPSSEYLYYCNITNIFSICFISELFFL